MIDYYAEGGLSRRGILGALATAAAGAIAKKGKGLADNVAPVVERGTAERAAANVARQAPHALESLRIPQHIDTPIQEFFYDIVMGGKDDPAALSGILDNALRGSTDLTDRTMHDAVDAVRAIQGNAKTPMGRYFISRFHPSTSEPTLDDSMMDMIYASVDELGKKKYSIKNLLEEMYDSGGVSSGGKSRRATIDEALDDLKNVPHSRLEDGNTVSYYDYIQSQIDEYLNDLLMR